MFGLFSKKKVQKGVTHSLLIFQHPTTVISVEELLKDEGYSIRVVSPPASHRTGCDLSVEILSEFESDILNLLDLTNLLPMDVLPITSEGQQPLQFIRSTDYQDHLMVRSANMKMTVDKHTKVIVNISGGGCPDVPYLATMMLGKKISDLDNPGDIGYSLCAYSLNTSREELIKLIG